MRKLMWFTMGFGAACAIGAYCYVPWLWCIAVAALVLTGLLIVGMRWFKPLRIGVAVLLGFSIGLGWFVGYDRIHISAARNADGEKLAVTIIARDFSYETNYGCAFVGEVTIDGTTYSVRTYLHTKDKLSPGDRVEGTFKFRLTAVGGLDEPTYHQGKGIFLLAYPDGDCVVTKGGGTQLTDYPAIWRNKLIGIIENAFPEDVSGFAKALLLGDRTGIDYQTSTAFKVSGISHVIAVSGLHVSILFGLIYMIALRRRWLTALIGIPAVILFAAITGFSPSIVRAGIMQIFVMLALALDQEYDGPTALSFSVIVMLAVNPLTVTSVSFQLSVGCMVGIFLFFERIRSWLCDKKRLGRWKGRFIRWISSSVSITLSAMVFTTPLVALYFGAVSLVGVITNLVVLWLITYIFYGIMLVCAVSRFHGGIAACIGWVIAWPIRFVVGTANVLSAFPLAAVYTKSIYVLMWLVFCYVLLAVFLFVKKRPALFAGSAVIGLCLAVACSWAETLLYDCSVAAMDVGQGQCILLQSAGKIFLVDCGGSYDDDAADIAAETLLSQGINRLDGIIVTHYDKDHVGGVPYLLTRIDADTVYLPYTQDEDGVGESIEAMGDWEIQTVKDDLEITFGDACLTIFAPISYKSGNESSMCVLFQTQKCDILVTGDRDQQGEDILLQRYDIPELDLLVVGHHGARTSTGEELLAKTKPKYAFISVGEDNPYNHPADETLTRLRKYGCEILRTDLYGTLYFRR